MGLLTGDSAEVHESGESAAGLGAVGSLACVECGYGISLSAIDDLPQCPACGGSRFKRASLFEQPTVDTDAVPPPEEAPVWLEALRANVRTPGYYLAFEDEDEPTLVAVNEGWTRIGRSGAADIQLDDPTVSRRHALVVRTPEGELRALDDRSLNGLFVNGERIEWAPLSDGDELEIGRYRIFVIDAY